MFFLHSVCLEPDSMTVVGKDVSSFDLSCYYRAIFDVFVEILPNLVPEAEVLSLSDRVISLLAACHVHLCWQTCPAGSGTDISVPEIDASVREN